MAQTVVEIPGVGNVEFPASMSTADISAAAAKLHAQANPPAGAHPEARMSAAEPGLGFGADPERVTLGDLRSDPVDAMTRIGASLKRDLSDPKFWIQAAAMYFALKVVEQALPVVAKAASGMAKGAVRGTVSGVAAVGDAVSPDVIGMVSPRVGKAVDFAQRMRTAMSPTSAPSPDAGHVSLPGYPRVTQTPAPAAAPVAAPPAPRPTRTPAPQIAPPPSAEFNANLAAAQARAVAARATPAPTPVDTPAPVESSAPSEPPAIRMVNGKLEGRPGGNPDLPNARADNEAALAARRAAYQASQSPTSIRVVEVSGKLHFTAPEWAAFRELRARGWTQDAAANAAKAAGELARQLKTATPAEVQTALASRGLKGR